MDIADFRRNITVASEADISLGGLRLSFILLNHVTMPLSEFIFFSALTVNAAYQSYGERVEETHYSVASFAHLTSSLSEAGISETFAMDMVVSSS